MRFQTVILVVVVVITAGVTSNPVQPSNSLPDLSTRAQSSPHTQQSNGPHTQQSNGPHTQQSDTCYQLTTFDYKRLALTQTGEVVVADLYEKESNSTLAGFLLRFLDPAFYSFEYSVPENVFIWEIISSDYQNNNQELSSTLYLSAVCGENLKVNSSVNGEKIPLDGLFTRYNSSDFSNFRYKLYTSENCYLQIQPNGEIMAVDFTYYNLQVSLQRFPVYNSLYDMTLQVERCPPGF